MGVYLLFRLSGMSELTNLKELNLSFIAVELQEDGMHMLEGLPLLELVLVATIVAVKHVSVCFETNRNFRFKCCFKTKSLGLGSEISLYLRMCETGHFSAWSKRKKRNS